jgi:hypothetical protein
MKSAQWALSFTKRTDRGRQAWRSWYSLYRNFANAIQMWLPVTSVLRRKELTYTEKGNKWITIIFIISVIICLDIVIFFLYQQWSLLFKFETSDCITSLIICHVPKIIIFIITVIICLDIVIFSLYQQWSLINYTNYN